MFSGAWQGDGNEPTFPYSAAKVEQLSISNSHLSLVCQIQHFIIKLTVLSLHNIVTGITQKTELQEVQRFNIWFNMWQYVFSCSDLRLVQLKKDYWYNNKYLGNKCGIKKIISLSFRNTVWKYWRWERRKQKPFLKITFYNDYTNGAKESVIIFQIFQ